MRVALVQTSLKNKEANLHFLEETLRKCTKSSEKDETVRTSKKQRTDTGHHAETEEHTHLVVFPELFIGGYNVGARLATEAEEKDGATFQLIAKLCRELHVAVVYGYAEKVSDGAESKQCRFYNSAMMIDDEGNCLLNYRKTHLYGAYEAHYFVAGDSLSGIAEYRGMKCALMICYDVEFPEPVRALCLKGAEFLIVPTANTCVFNFDVTVPSRAFENQCFIAYVNRTGTEDCQFKGMDPLTFCGSSVMVAPNGEILAKLSRTDEGVVHGVVDGSKSDYAESRKHNPYLLDRRPELYTDVQSLV